MLELLQIAALKEDIFFRVAFLQRNLLELDARIQFLKLQEQHSSLESRQTSVPGCLAVIGAFTDNFATLTRLYKAGVPVWFVRRVEDTPDARIDSTAPVIAEDRFQCFTLPSGFRVDGSDAEPPHQVVWEGLPNRTERYAAMSAYLQSLLYPPSLFGSDSIRGISLSKGIKCSSGPARDVLVPARDVRVQSASGSSSSLRLVSHPRSTPCKCMKSRNPRYDRGTN
ncbi:hypothetical protein EV361DRAFT_813068 [Lentinula raphanica]|nr:hypothetical protein EV361DRAFT_813068 [Lentinula raphanica]